MLFKNLNNKGYMLVEIILASVLAMGIAYFMTDLTIKLKNKNDDLLVKTLVATDQAIIYNTIMKDLYENVDDFTCSKIEISGNKFTYNSSFTNIVTEYATLGTFDCDDSTDEIKIKIPINVKQLPDEDFDINIKREKSDL